MSVRVLDGNEEFIEALFAATAVGFEWGKVRKFKNGILSPGAYLDCRKLQSHPLPWSRILSGMRWGIESAGAMLNVPPTNVIASVATAGIIHGGCLARDMHLPHVTVKKQEKTTHGLGGLIDGDVDVLPRAQVTLVEDMSSTFTSTREAMEPLEAAGATVVHTMAISSWGFPEFYEHAEGHDVTVLCVGRQLVKYAEKKYMLDHSYVDLLLDWLEDPHDQRWISDWWTMPA